MPMGKSASSTEFSVNELNKDYQKLLQLIKPVVLKLDDSKDTTLCLLWLAKLDEASDIEKPLRNELLAKLAYCAVRKRLEGRFCEPPPPGPLAYIDMDSSRVSEDLTYQTSAPGSDREPSSRTLLSSIAQNEDKAQKLKDTIAHYRTVLSDLLHPSNKEYTTKTRRPNKPCVCEHRNVRDYQRADDVQVSIKRKVGGNLNNVDRLAEDNRNMAAQSEINGRSAPSRLNDSQKIAELETTIRHIKENQKNMLACFRRELKDLLSKKDQTIADLVHEISTSSGDYASAMEQSAANQFDMLELKYQKLLEKHQMDYRRERQADRKKIRHLESVIMSANLNPRR